MKPFVKIGHRFGNVFFHLVNMTKLGQVSRVLRLSPKDALKIAEELKEAALRAAGQKPQGRRTLLVYGKEQFELR